MIAKFFKFVMTARNMRHLVKLGSVGLRKSFVRGLIYTGLLARVSQLPCMQMLLTIVVSFAPHLATAALRTVDLVADKSNNVYRLTPCECDFGDNYWFALLSEVRLPQPRFRARASSNNHKPLVDCDDHLETLRGQRGRHWPAGVAEVRHLMAADRGGDLAATWALFELCLPGQFVKSMYCAKRYLVSTGNPMHTEAAWPHLAQGRRLFRLVSGCLASSPWPLDRRLLRRALAFGARGSVMTKRLFPSFARWPLVANQCVPLRRSCWPSVAGLVSESCELCCDADAAADLTKEFVSRFPSRGKAAGALLASCCNDGSREKLGRDNAPAQLVEQNEENETKARDDFAKDVLTTLWRAVPDPELETLRKTLRKGCASSRGSQNYHSSSNAPSGNGGGIGIFQLWISRAARAAAGGYGQRIFPREDLLVTRHACVDTSSVHEMVDTVQRRGLVWFAAAPLSAMLLPAARASGLRLAADHGGLCGGGVAVHGEGAASAARGEVVIVPCSGNYSLPLRSTASLRDNHHVMEPYALELMEPRRYRPPLRHRSTCKGGDPRVGSSGSSDGGIAILLGEVPNNPGHWIHLALWLYKVASGPALGRILRAFPGKPLTLVQTKYAAAQCEGNGLFCTPRSLDLRAMPHAWLLVKPALMQFERRGIAVAWADLLASSDDGASTVSGGGAKNEPLCFELALQPWREWPGGARVYDDFGRNIAGLCQYGPQVTSRPLRQQGLPRRAAAFERTSVFRGWDLGTRQALQAGLIAWGRATNVTVDWVRLGELSPCGQLRVVSRSSLLVGIAGAENSHAAFMPRGGALIEVDPFCAQSTKVRQGASQDDGGEGLRKVRLSRCCRSNFAQGRENCAPRHDLPQLETAWRWRGPGTIFRNDVWRRAVRLAAKRAEDGGCEGRSPQDTACDTGAAAEQAQRRWAPVGRWAELARARGLVYLSVVRCNCSMENVGTGVDCAHLFRQGALHVDVEDDVLPALFAIYDEYLRPRLVSSSSPDM
eukprot:TRINITY_DN54515_c0_g1_i1.p1 TRINITY_DN54515_c0_g1~~TRINITY_DN54515_c0_g1_i1.p1  ORF type:complete len:1000 (-),score=112.27 TRINITY_DN54515_c0_g1_i1:39-3038(-)